MAKIIITTTASLSKTVEETDLKDALKRQGVEVVLFYEFDKEPPFSKEDVFAIVAGHTPEGEMLHIGPEEVALFPNVRVVSPFGIGRNHLDVDGLEAKGIDVKTVPHFSKRTVAELTLSYIFALARRLVPLTIAIRGGVWQREDGMNIHGKILGIIGLGNIGKEVAKLGKAIGMHVLGNDLVYDDSFMSEFAIERAEKDFVFKNSDFITLHVPYTEQTGGMVNSDVIGIMKQGAFLINAARGEVVDEQAVLEALKNGKLAGAALDVFSSEPPFGDPVLNELVQHPNTITTPHIGAYTPETRYVIAEYVCNEVLSYKERQSLL